MERAGLYYLFTVYWIAFVANYAEKIHQQQKAERISTNLEGAKIKNYGGMLYGGSLPNNSRIVVKDRRDNSSNSSYFIGKAPMDGPGGEPKDPGEIEFSQQHLDNYGPIEERTSFENKIDESIYRTKKHLLKTKGSWD